MSSGVNLTEEEAALCSTALSNVPNKMSQSSTTLSQPPPDKQSEPKNKNNAVNKQSKSSVTVVQAKNVPESESSTRGNNTKSSTTSKRIVASDTKQPASINVLQIPVQAKNVPVSESSTRGNNTKSSTTSKRIVAPGTKQPASVRSTNTAASQETRIMTTIVHPNAATVPTSSTPKRIRKRKNGSLRDIAPQKRGRRSFIYVDIDELFSESWKGNVLLHMYYLFLDAHNLQASLNVDDNDQDLPENVISNDIVEQADEAFVSDIDKIEHAKTIVKIVKKWIGPGISYVEQLGTILDAEDKPKCMCCY